jgi:hypothetical protein
VNLGKYINILAREQDIVIIPGLGAFISEYKPAQIDESTGNISPPSKEISFDKKIKNNDGLLAAEIALREKISEHEALAVIESEVDDILYRLDKGEKVILDKTGILYFDKTGTIQFESTQADNLLPDSFGLESTSLLYDNKDADYQQDEIVPAETEDSVNPEKAEESESNESENAEEEIIKDPGKSEKPEIKSVPSWYSAPEDRQGKKHSGGKKRVLLWLLILFIILAAAGVFAWNHFRNRITPAIDITEEPPVAEDSMEPAPEAESQNIVPTDSTKADSVKISLTDSLDSVQRDHSTGYVTPDTSKYYLVGGSFAEPENADKYLEQMKKKGFEPFHLGKHGSFYIIALETYDNEIEAYGAQYNFLDKYPDSGVWIFIPQSGQN